MIQLPLWGEEGPESVAHEQDFSDILFLPVRPEPADEPELSPEEQRVAGFFQEALPFEGENFANPDAGWHQGGRNVSEVCVLSGWPPRHLQVGQHCPHGLGDGDDDEIIDYT